MAGAVRTVESRCLARPGLSLGKSQLRQVIDPAVAVGTLFAPRRDHSGACMQGDRGPARRP